MTQAATAGNNELDNCKRAEGLGAVLFEAHFVALSSLAFAPAGGRSTTLFAFFQNTKPSPAVVARTPCQGAFYKTVLTTAVAPRQPRRTVDHGFNRFNLTDDCVWLL